MLGGGGRQGDAWMTGVLAGLEDAHGIAFAGCDHFVGTSAGAIVAAKLAAGRSLRRPVSSGVGAGTEVGAGTGEPSPWPTWAVDSAMAVAAPFASIGLRLASRPAEMVRSTALGALSREAEAAPDFRQAFAERRVRFDGRVRIVAVERESGRRVVFGGPGAPHATVAQALTASCALPLVFAPAVIDGREYVDGAVWSPTNADVAPASRDAHVLILATMASRYGPWNAALRAATGALLLAEASALKARGAHVRIITPDRGSAASIGTDLMSDERLAETGAAGYAQGLRA